MSSSNGMSTRTLNIKTGTVQRTIKDLESYRDELKDIEQTLQRVRASDDHSMLKQWETVLAETQAMIPDSTSRLCAAIDDLTALIETIGDEQGIKGSDDLNSARDALSRADNALKQQ